MLDLLHARYLRQPREVSIETLALCNAACTFCPYPTLERQGVALERAIITRLIDEMSGWETPFFVSPFKVNEPLLDDRLPEICADIITRCPKAKLRLFTNGTPLVSRQVDWIERLPLGRLEHLWISLNSTDPDEYAELMKLSYASITKRLNELHARVAAGTFRHPVIVSRVMADDGRKNWRFANDVRKHWPLFQTFLIKRDGWLGYVEPTSPEIPQAPCGRWFELSITAEGKAALCCMDGTGEYSIGSILNSSLLEIYNQPHLIERRKSALTRKGIEPCQRCTY